MGDQAQHTRLGSTNRRGRWRGRRGLSRCVGSSFSSKGSQTTDKPCRPRFSALDRDASVAKFSFLEFAITQATPTQSRLRPA